MKVENGEEASDRHPSIFDFQFSTAREPWLPYVLILQNLAEIHNRIDTESVGYFKEMQYDLCAIVLQKNTHPHKMQKAAMLTVFAIKWGVKFEKSEECDDAASF